MSNRKVELNDLNRATINTLIELLDRCSIQHPEHKVDETISTAPRAPRVETAVVQFGSDWPGVFIRGDDAARILWALKGLVNDKTD